MTQITVTLNLDEIITGHSGSTLLDLIVFEASRQLLEQIGKDEAIAEMRTQVRNMRDREIRDRVQPLVREALDQAIQRTDSYGQPKGEPTTLSEIIVDTAKKMLTEQTGGYNEKKQSMVAKIIESEVRGAITTELKAALDEARLEVAGVVRAKGAELIEETIARMAGVKR